MAQSSQRDGLENGDTVVVTGAAQGLGRGIALRLSGDGARGLGSHAACERDWMFLMCQGVRAGDDRSG